MRKRPTRLKKLRIREISLCEQGMNQHSHIVLHKAADPEPAAPTVADMAKALKGASPEALEIVKQQIESHARIIEQLRKLNNPQETDTMTKTTADIVKAYQERHDVDHDVAFKAVMNRPEFAAAYEAENSSGHIARQVEKRQKAYGE